MSDSSGDIASAAPELIGDLPVALTFIAQAPDFGSVTITLTLDLTAASNASLASGTLQARSNTLSRILSCLAIVARMLITASRNMPVPSRYSSVKDLKATP